MKDNDSLQSEYFEAYEDLEIHHLMLQDEPRNEVYRKAVFNNKEFISGKIVLDVGAGTGILSIFCAQAGASKVFAVEASGLYKIAEEVVKENQLEDIVEVIHCKVEDLTLPSDLKVDIIISEWMGFYLLHEGMLDSVIMARDKFLKDGGLMFPESATIYSAPCIVPSMYSFWNNISGISMQSVGKRYRELKSQKPEVLDISKDNLLTEGSSIFWADLRDITLEELDTLYYQNIMNLSYYPRPRAIHQPTGNKL
ncbi:Arginine methyltransferase 8 [Carabus blaptoides fortunei]